MKKASKTKKKFKMYSSERKMSTRKFKSRLLLKEKIEA